MFFYQSKEYITFKERFVIGFEIHLKKCYHVGLQIIPPVCSLLFLGVVKANEPDLLKEHGGSLELTEDWARHLLKSMEWVKREGTTCKVEPSEKFLQDETPLSYVSPGKYTFCLEGTTTVPIKGVDDKRQITATFTVSASGVFLPIQLIYQGKLKDVCQNLNSQKNSTLPTQKIISQTSGSASSYSKK